ncbi:methyltransferase domain-containing protein [Edaphobacter sp. 12200R-103]|uniref:methyltransferase domain-containing protein n=1 Tax=Edaphobacter sp. 12200R-103 TaxID=2703788 RepID=UPI00138C1A7E|nr:methyltransferase domain-containing protein [Edaphobacter sp. 12200R-103]QHS51755.1 methyltransferase domain-containing protein [Edaphobacter sp. 12200R-103]
MKAPTNSTAQLDNSAAFAAWAEVYDTQLNPMLALEERYLNCVLPSVDGKDVLDAGCGTGRWLRRLANIGSPQSLHGIDSSPEMLTSARRACTRETSLILAQLPTVPLLSASIDLALCSFALSYISDLESLASQFRRILREDGDLLITDLHPDTAMTLGWQRSFRSSEISFHLQFEPRLIEAILHAFDQQDFQTVGLYQPSFGEPEYSIFASQGKQASYNEANGQPAIYILHLRPKTTRPGDRITLANANFVLGGQEVGTGNITIHNDAVASVISNYPQHRAHNDLDLSGYTLFPGLINAHDHLEFGLFPRLGSPPYQNATEWARDIHNHCRPIIEKHTRIPRDIRLWWGALRNLLCGATTVCHHNPASAVFSDPQFPVRVLTEFDWAHSLTFSTNIGSMHTQSALIKPFILHACEGIDSTAKSEFTQLLDMNVLDERTVLVHGLAMDVDEIIRLNQCGASLISCPSSNQFLFSQTPSIEQLSAVDRLAIGSDSSLTADGDLLDEIRFCHTHLQLSSGKLFNFAMHAPAIVLQLKGYAGCLMPGGPADLFAVRSCSQLPAQQLVSLSWRDIELVIIAGTIRLASNEMMHRIPAELTNSLSPLLIDGVTRWIAAPVTSLFEAAAGVLGTDRVCLNGRLIAIPEAQHVH